MRAIPIVGVVVGLLIEAVYGQFIQTNSQFPSYTSIQSNNAYPQCDFTGGGQIINGFQQGQTGFNNGLNNGFNIGFNSGVNPQNNLYDNSAISNLYRQRVQNAGLANGQQGLNGMNNWGLNNQQNMGLGSGLNSLTNWGLNNQNNGGLPGQQLFNTQTNSMWGLNNQNGLNTGSGQWAGNSGQGLFNTQNSMFSQLFGNGNSWANNNNYNTLGSNLGTFANQYQNPGSYGFSALGNSFQNYWNNMNGQNNLYNNRNFNTASLYANQNANPYQQQQMVFKRKRRQALASGVCRCLPSAAVPNFASVIAQASSMNSLGVRNQYLHNTSGRCAIGTYCMCPNQGIL